MLNRALELMSDTRDIAEIRMACESWIEIAAVIVWRVEDSAQAVFDVDNYESYVRIQSETAVRHLANS